MVKLNNFGAPPDTKKTSRTDAALANSPERMRVRMRIAGSVIQMRAEHQYTEAHRREETLRMWRDAPSQDRLDVSVKARQQAEAAEASVVTAAKSVSPKQVWDGLSEEDRTRLILLEALFGIRVTIPGWRTADDTDADAPPPPAAPAAPRHGWGIDYEYRESYRETERLAVDLSGTIRTADGAEIAFSVTLRMSREFAVEHSLRLQLGDKRPVDPLVINYAGHAADLTGGHFDFDLDGDGTTESVPLLRQGSGFLVLDRDGDGRVNSGLELFGPATGDGFAELAGFDDDGNGWIDAGDDIYNQLRIWTPDADGRGRLLALGEVGIGAIYVGNIAAPYTYKSAANNPLAVNTAVGLFVRENGSVGTVQQLDFFV